MSTTYSAPTTAATIWSLDPAHSVAEFKVKHMVISNVKGQFTGIAGVLTLDKSDVSRSQVSAEIHVSTMNTREAQRDAHAKGADFVNVKHFPTMSFRSTQVKRTGDDELAVTGYLTIHGVTRHITFQVEGPTPAAMDPWGNTRIGVSATTRINRKEFGLGWNTAVQTGGILVGEDVTIARPVRREQQGLRRAAVIRGRASEEGGLVHGQGLKTYASTGGRGIRSNWMRASPLMTRY